MFTTEAAGGDAGAFWGAVAAAGRPGNHGNQIKDLALTPSTPLESTRDGAVIKRSILSAN